MKQRPTCTYPDCHRTRQSAKWCKQHHLQLKNHGEQWTIGDRTHERAAKRAAWDRLTDDEKAARIAPMLAAIRSKPRSAEHSRRISESLKARNADRPYVFTERTCRACGEAYMPNSGHQFYCTPECKAAQRRLRRHGLTNRQYLDILADQGGTCALCTSTGRGYGGSRYALVVDHCHDTGTVRGLLCPDCNTALGRFGDDAARLRAAADYIDRTCPH
jgi:hypothetical protein